MKKRYILLPLILFILVTIIGCQQKKLTDEEYQEFKNEFYIIYEDLSEKIVDRVALWQRINDNIDKDIEIEKEINSLDKLVKDVENRIQDYQLDSFQQYSNVLNAIKSLELGYTTGDMTISESIEYMEELIKFVKFRFAEENGLSDEEVEKILYGESLENKIDKYKMENDIIIDWKDVEYDIANYLDTDFVVAGTGELSDYYNYGFDDYEKSYFCVCIIPPDSKFSERWYLYFHRESFDKLFKDLKEREVEIIATCEIPKYIYKQGQGNMAKVKQVQWFND